MQEGQEGNGRSISLERSYFFVRIVDPQGTRSMYSIGLTLRARRLPSSVVRKMKVCPMNVSSVWVLPCTHKPQRDTEKGKSESTHTRPE